MTEVGAGSSEDRKKSILTLKAECRAFAVMEEWEKSKMPP